MLRQVQCGGGLRASHSKYECAPFQSVRGTTTCTVGRFVMAKGARRLSSVGIIIGIGMRERE